VRSSLAASLTLPDVEAIIVELRFDLVADAAAGKGLFIPHADSIASEAQSSLPRRIPVFAGHGGDPGVGNAEG
jgi:hypothetical protein